MIGKLINEFDNSHGTVQDFNRLFPFAKLEDESGEVEILGIADNELIRNISVNGELRQHYFGRTSDTNPATGRKLNKGGALRYLYYAEKDGKIHEFNRMGNLAKFLNRKLPTVSLRFNRLSAKPEINGYKLSRRRL